MMLDPRLQLRHLRCFLETARLGTVSAAAEQLNLSQPAASKTLRELEQILGKTLFDRRKRRLVLTAAGRVLQQTAGPALLTLGRAQDLVRGAPSSAGKLAVGVLPTAATALMPRAALAFQQRRPDCLLRISTGPNWLLLSQLREGSLDLVVGRMASAEVMSDLSFRHLYSENIAAVVRAGHPLIRSPDPMAALGRYPLILPPPGAVIAPLVRALLSEAGIDPQAARFESVSLAFGRGVLQRSDAVWLISQGVVGAELASGELAALPLPHPLQGGPVGVSMRAGLTLGDPHRALIEALEQACAHPAPPDADPGPA